MQADAVTPPSITATQVVKLCETPEQEPDLWRNASASRIAKNDLVVLWRHESAKPKGQRLKKRQLRPACNRVKYAAHPWFAEVSQNSVKGGYLDAEDAITRYYKGQCRRPKLHSKYDRRPSFRADNGVGTVKLDQHGRLVLPKLMGGVFRIRGLRWRGTIRQCRVYRKGGSWYASLVMAVAPDAVKGRVGIGPAGLDLGLKTFATIAWPSGEVEKVSGPEPLKAALTRLRRAQRRVSRRKKGSKRRREAVEQVQRVHRQVENIRKDFLHKLSDRIVSGCDALAIETLNLRGWQKLWGRKSSDLAPGEFLRQLEYKTGWRGTALIKADAWYPSSQICHFCGVRGDKAPLDVREWRCGDCVRDLDRDENAAQNLRKLAAGSYSVPDRGGCVRRGKPRNGRRSGNLNKPVAVQSALM